MIFQHIEAFVFYFPARSAASHNFRDLVARHRQARDPRHRVRHAAFGVQNLEPDPVHVHRVLPIADRHVVDPAITVRERLVALADFLVVFFCACAVDQIVQAFVRRFLAREDKIIAALNNHLRDRLAGGVVAM